MSAHSKAAIVHMQTPVPEPHPEISELLVECASQTESLLDLAQRELTDQEEIDYNFRNNLFNVLLRIQRLNSVVCSLACGFEDEPRENLLREVYGVHVKPGGAT